jgi:hypothetical protein
MSCQKLGKEKIKPYIVPMLRPTVMIWKQFNLRPNLIFFNEIKTEEYIKTHTLVFHENSLNWNSLDIIDMWSKSSKRWTESASRLEKILNLYT